MERIMEQEYKITNKWNKERIEEIERIKNHEGLTPENLVRHAKTALNNDTDNN